MNIKQVSSDGKIAYLIKPILKVLQEAGGQLERSEIKARMFPKSFIHTDHLYMQIALREKENLTTEIQVRL